MKSFYKKHHGYKLLLKDIAEKYGAEKAEAICRSAQKELDGLRRKYFGLPKKTKRHTDDNIFPRVAIYRIMQKEIPGNELKMLDKASSEIGGRVNRLLNRITHFPGMAVFFLRAMSYMERKMYGPDAGFATVFHADNNEKVRFDITKCPYFEYCSICGCPELAKTFCKSDIYCYGNLDKIAFERSETIGTGGTKCDFCFSTKKMKRG